MPPRDSLPKNLCVAISKKLKRNECVQVICPLCKDFRAVLSFKTFREEHVRVVHHLDPKLECVFCGGEFKWRAGQKGSREVGAHIYHCLNSFLQDHLAIRKEPPQICTQVPRPTKPREGLCECVTFDSPSLAFDLSERVRFTQCEELYQPLVNEKPEHFWYKPTLGDVAFQRQCGLGCEAAGMIRMQRSGRWTFYHLFLRPCVIRKFNEVMGDPKRLHHVVVSPYGCLCDGMRAFDDEGGRTHRHVLVATDRNAEFARACKKVRCQGARHAYCQRKYKIGSTAHLISAIRYVSSPESHCGRRQFPQAHDPCIAHAEVDAKAHHYYMTRPMHWHAIVAMSVLYPGGLRWLVTKYNAGKKIIHWEYRERRQPDGRWKYSVRLGDTGIEMQNCVLRWAKDLELVGEDIPGEEEEDCEPPYIPVEHDDESEDEAMEVEEVSISDEVVHEEEKPLRIFFLQNSKVLRSNPAVSHWPDRDWLMHQAKHGNRFLKCVENEDWQFSKQQACTANQIRVVKEKWMQRLTDEMNKAQDHFREKEKLQEEMKEHLLEDLKRQDEQLRSRDEQLRSRDEQLRDQNERLRLLENFLIELGQNYVVEMTRQRASHGMDSTI